MSFNAQFVRFIPFVVDEENTKSNDALLDPFVFSKWSISKSSGLWFDMELLEKKFDKDGIDA